MRIKFLIFMAWFTAILGLLSAAMLDSKSTIPAIVCGACVAWWAIFGYANDWFDEQDEDEEEEDDQYERKDSEYENFRRIM